MLTQPLLRARRRTHRSGILIGTVHGHFHAAVLCLSGAAARLIHRFIFPEADHMDAVNRNIVLRNQVSHHGVRAPFAQSGIVLVGAHAIGESFHRDEEPLVLALARHHLFSLSLLNLKLTVL